MKHLLSVMEENSVMGNTMYHLIAIGADNQSMEDFEAQLKDVLPSKYKKEVRTSKICDKTPIIRFWVSQEEKEILEDNGNLSVWSKTRKWD